MYPGVLAYEGKGAELSSQRTNGTGLLILLEKKPGRAQRYFATMGYQHRLVLAALVTIAVTSCKKEEDAQPPVVTIVAPGNGFDLSVPDTLNVVADISGDQDIDEVSFTITNASGIVIMEPLIVTPASNPARVEVALPITSDLIASADYTLMVQANSGDARGKDYAQIDIIGTPLRLRRLLVIGQPDAGSVSIHVIDSTGTVSLANTLLMDLGGAAVSSAGRTFVVMGTVQGPLVAFAPDGIQVPWQKPNLGNSGIPWFTSLDLCADGRYYAGTTDGSLRGYNVVSGATERVVSLPANFRAGSASIVDQRLVVALVDQTGSAWRLGVYQATSGAMVAEHVLEEAVTAMFKRGDTHVLLFGNRDGHGVVEDHDVENGGGWEPYQWNSTITAVEQTDANTHLVALADGSLERFTYSNAGSVTVANIPDVRDLSMDPVSGLVYVAAGTSVLAINPQNGLIASNYAIGSPVHHVLPLLNR